RAAELSRRFFNWATIAIAVGVILIIVTAGALFLSGAEPSLSSGLHRSDRRFIEILMIATKQVSPGIVLWSSLSILGAVVALSSILKGQASMQSAGIALIAVAGTLFWYGSVNPALANEETLQPFAAVVDSSVPPGIPIDYIGPFDCDLAFYSDHEIASLKTFQCATASRDAFFLVWQDRFGKL